MDYTHNDGPGQPAAGSSHVREPCDYIESAEYIEHGIAPSKSMKAANSPKYAGGKSHKTASFATKPPDDGDDEEEDKQGVSGSGGGGGGDDKLSVLAMNNSNPPEQEQPGFDFGEGDDYVPDDAFWKTRIGKMIKAEEKLKAKAEAIAHVSEKGKQRLFLDALARSLCRKHETRGCDECVQESLRLIPKDTETPAKYFTWRSELDVLNDIWLEKKYEGYDWTASYEALAEVWPKNNPCV